jgi:hypothetical protein
VAAVAGTDEVLDKVAEKLRELQQAAEDRLLAVRVSLCGRTPAHAKLLAQRHHWIAEIRARARDLSGGRIWVEKVLIGTSPPETAAKTDAIVDSARGEIAALVEELRAAPERLSELDVDFAAVLRALPGELQEVSEIGRCVDSAWLAGILEEAGSVLRSSFEEDEEKS